MFKTCGLAVGALGMDRGLPVVFPQALIPTKPAVLENSGFIPTLHNFYTHTFTLQISIFTSVISDFYTVCTRLIITKTIYI